MLTERPTGIQPAKVVARENNILASDGEVRAIPTYDFPTLVSLG